jgi:hypothetical protein
MGEMRNTYKILFGKHEGKTHLEDLGVDGKVILKWILGERMGGRGLDLLGSKRGSYEHGNRPKDFAP